MQDPTRPTSETVLRSFAPRCLREPFLRALAVSGGPSLLLGRRLYFIEVVARYLTALLAADPAVVGAPPPEVVQLVDRLGRPTLGHWLQAADALARTIVRVGGPLAAVATVLRDPGGGFTVARDALDTLCRARNRIVHADGGPVGSSDEARRWLEDIGPAWHAVVAALGFVQHHPVGCVDALMADSGGRLEATVLWFVGPEPGRRLHRVSGAPLPPRQPFVVGADDDLHALPPFATSAVFARGGDTELRLVWRADRETLLYSTPVADEPAAPLDPSPSTITMRWGAPDTWMHGERPRLPRDLPRVGALRLIPEPTLTLERAPSRALPIAAVIDRPPREAASGPAPRERLLSLPGVAGVEERVGALGARTLVARSGNGQVRVLVRVLGSLPDRDPRHDPHVVRLLSVAVADNAPLIGVTDGRRWIWMRRTGHRTLRVVDDPVGALIRADG